MSEDYKINFIVYSPFPEYVSYIGGATVPHTLANYLHLLGENAYIYSNSTKSNYNTRCISWGMEIDYDIENTVLILIAGAGEHTFEHNIPDCIKKIPNVVRWLVNHQVKLYPTEDRFYTYHKYWRVLDGQRIDGELSVIESNKDIFFNKNLKREGTCYLIKGGLDTEKERAIHSPQDLCIDDVLYSIPNSEKMNFYSELFNRMEYFICYTPFSYTSVLAAMCGCKSVVIPKKEYDGITFDKDKWMNEIWCAKYGIAIGLEDLPRAEATMNLVIPNIKHYEENIQHTQIKTLISDSYIWLREKYNLND